MNQPSLPFFTSNRCPVLKAPSDIEERVHRNSGSRKAQEPVEARATRWIAQHPQVYDLFKRFTLELIATGRTRYSAKAIIERVRWETDVRGGKPFKIANMVTAYLARRFCEENPEYSEFFKIVKGK